MSTDPTRTWIRRASTAAGLAYTAIAEYELARRLGARVPIAVMLPMSIDCYVIAALKWFRPLDVALSLILMCAAQVAAHALEAGVVSVSLNLVTVVSLLVPLALWRTHALARSEHDVPAEPVVEYNEPVEVQRVPDVPATHPEIAERVPAIPQAVPEGARLLPLVARPQPAQQVHILAANGTRTRTQVHTEYVPDPPAEGSFAMEMGLAAEQFKTELFAGEIPSIRAIKERLSVGQDKAKQIQEAFKEAQVAYRLAGQGVSS